MSRGRISKDSSLRVSVYIQTRVISRSISAQYSFYYIATNIFIISFQSEQFVTASTEFSDSDSQTMISFFCGSAISLPYHHSTVAGLQ